LAGQRPRQRAPIDTTGLFRDLKLDGPLCFLLYDDRTLRDQAAVADIAYAQLYQVTRPQFAVDREIE